MTRADGKSFRRVLFETVWWWDLAAAAIVGAGTLVIALTDDRFDPERSLFVAGAALTGALMLGVWVAGRWMSDHLSRTDLGTVVRAIDSDETATQLPYLVVVASAGVGCLVCVLGAIGIEAFPKWLSAAVSSLALALVAYTVLGVVALGVITFRFQRDAARIRALRERAERAERRSRAPSS